MNLLTSLFDTSDLAPHGMCLLWRPELVWLHVMSDAIIGLAYYSIPIALVWFILRRRDLEFGWVFWLFAIFILACGTTHFISIWTLWNPNYGTEGLVKAVTAMASILTAFMLWPLLPRALALPSPTQLRLINVDLEAEVARRAAVEAQLRASEAKYAGFFANLAEGLFIVEPCTDGSFRYETINPALSRVSGLAPEALNGRSPEDVLNPEQAAAVRQHYADCIAAGAPIEYEEQLDLPIGQRSWHTILVPLRDADGRITRILGSARDITERQRLQQELAQASKLATVGTLAAGIAHELSQPLNIMGMWAQNAMRRLRDGAVEADYLTRVMTVMREQTRRMAAIIDHMQTFTRRDGADDETFDARTSVASAVALVESQYGLSDVRIEQDLPTGACLVRGRPVQLEQVVINLLSNARDAILAGAAHGTIRLRMTVDRRGGYTTIVVADDGGGIPQAIFGKLFDPFFTTKEAGSGTGLGLAVSYGIVDGMGGRIVAENMPEGEPPGARFTITLPIVEFATVARGMAGGPAAAGAD